MKFECPECGKPGKIQTYRKNIVAKDGEMFPVKCQSCGFEFAISVIISMPTRF